jgi:hypothetical protein
MAWIDSRYLDQQRNLEREILRLRRELDELKLEIAASRTGARPEAKAARIAFEKLWHDLQLSAEQKAGFNPDQPRDDHGKWTDAGGDKEHAGDAPKPSLVSQPSAMRRGSPRMPATPAQQARLAIASARAREAVDRVQQLDPHWRPQSVTSHDNRDDYEVMIRAKEAETSEAEARFMALSRARQDAPYPMRDPPTTAEVLASGGNLRGYQLPGAGAKIRTVSPAEFEDMRVELMAGARQIERTGRYDGVWYRREDGSEIGLRISSDYGLTLEVIRSSHPLIPNGLRFHQR